MPAENSTRETQPPETRGHREWIDVSAVVSTSQQTGDGDVKLHQPSDETSQQGTEAQCHVGNDASEHTAETGFSPVLLASTYIFTFGKKNTEGVLRYYYYYLRQGWQWLFSLFCLLSVCLLT